jgi:hypothetical protein
MLRTPRCRLSAIKYLDRKIPKDVDHATKLIKDVKVDKELKLLNIDASYRGVHLSSFNMVVRDGKASFEEYQKGDKYQAWLLEEWTNFSKLQKGGDSAIEAYFYFYYPNKEQLVLNALLSGISPGDRNKDYVNRSTLDFLISHMSMTGHYLQDEERICLIEGCLLTLLKKDFAFLKKFFTWFQGHLEEDAKP